MIDVTSVEELLTFEPKIEEFVEDWKFTEAVKEAVKELHFSVNVS